MKREEWAYLGFGFGTAVVLGLAAWGAIELTKKIAARHKEKACGCGCEDGDASECECEECCDDECCDDECCDGESCDDGSCGDDSCGECCCGASEEENEPEKPEEDDFVEKSVNAKDEVQSSEFGNKAES
jgi:hypothetical protein